MDNTTAPSEPNVLTPPHHPERNYIWNALQWEAIKAYGQRCWAAGRSVETAPALSEAAPWKLTEGGAYESGEYALTERIDGKGWNATALIGGEDVHILLGGTLLEVQQAAEKHRNADREQRPAASPELKYEQGKQFLEAVSGIKAEDPGWQASVNASGEQRPAAPDDLSDAAVLYLAPMSGNYTHDEKTAYCAGFRRGLKATVTSEQRPATLSEAVRDETPRPWRVSPDGTSIHPDYRDDKGNSTPENWGRNGFAKVIVKGKNPDDLRLIVKAVNSYRADRERATQTTEAAPVLAQHIKELDHGKLSNDGRAGNENALLQLDGTREAGDGAVGVGQGSARMAEGANPSEAGVSTGADTQSDVGSRERAITGEPVAPYIDCDSPKLCAVHGRCAGRYGTQSICKPVPAAPVTVEVAEPHVAAPDVWEMNYCESHSCSLHPGVLYRFKVDPTCASCMTMARDHDNVLCPSACELADGSVANDSLRAAQAHVAAGSIPSEAELWSLIRAYAASRIDCDRSNGTISQAYLSLSESNLRDALCAALAVPSEGIASVAAQPVQKEQKS